MKNFDDIAFIEINMVETGKNIRALRLQNGISVKQLANFLNISILSIYYWEEGKKLPNLNNLLQLAYIYEVMIEDILQTKHFRRG